MHPLDCLVRVWVLCVKRVASLHWTRRDAFHTHALTWKAVKVTNNCDGADLNIFRWKVEPWATCKGESVFLRNACVCKVSRLVHCSWQMTFPLPVNCFTEVLWTCATPKIPSCACLSVRLKIGECPVQAVSNGGHLALCICIFPTFTSYSCDPTSALRNTTDSKSVQCAMYTIFRCWNKWEKHHFMQASSCHGYYDIFIAVSLTF